MNNHVCMTSLSGAERGDKCWDNSCGQPLRPITRATADRIAERLRLARELKAAS